MIPLNHLAIGHFLILFFSAAKIDFCYSTQHPELQILDHDERSRGIFCPGNTARLKCIFPEEMAALAWYVNGSERPIDIKYLPKDLPGHSVQSSPEGGYTVVNIFKEESYRANYSCAVYHISDNILSNSVEVIFQDTAPDGITATCIRNDSDSLTVIVTYRNGCRRETVVKANGLACSSVTKSPRMAVFQCGGLHPSTSYNITAVDSDGHVHSLHYGSLSSETATANMKEPTNFVYLAVLVVGLPVVVVAAAGIALLLVVYCYRKKRKHQLTPQDGAHKESDEQLGSTTCHNTVLTSDEIPPEESSQPNDKKPEELLQPSSSDSASSNSTKPLLSQDGKPGLNYATLDLSSTAGTIKPPPPHENVSYAFIEPQHTSV